MPTVSVPHEFFIQERENVYADWRSAFFRELISNSLDADSSSILIRAKAKDDETITLMFADNGSGMSRETLDNVYMRLGASTKGREDDTVGGFGRARILCAFSHKAYTIRGLDFMANGSGADYTVSDAPPRPAGTLVMVDIDRKHQRGLMSGLRRVLRESHLNAKILIEIDDELYFPFREQQVEPEGDDHPGRVRFKGWSHKGRKIGTLADDDGPWATIYFSNGQTANNHAAIVRVNGLSMYETYLGVPGQLTIDLVPGRSREILTASRDSIRGHAADEIAKLLTQVAIDKRSALGRRSDVETTRSAAGAHGSAFDLRETLGLGAAWMDAQEDQSTSEATTEPLDGRHAAQWEVVSAAPNLSSETQVEETTSTVDPSCLRLPVHSFIKDPTPQQRKASRLYSAEAWSQNDGLRGELLHALWTGACRYSLATLHKAIPEFGRMEGVNWATGFVFSETMSGMNKAFQGATYTFLLNPVDHGGKCIYPVSPRETWVALLGLALHEVAHCIEPYHDERFAGLLTDMTMIADQTQAFRVMGAEIDATRDWQKDRKKEVRAAA